MTLHRYLPRFDPISIYNLRLSDLPVAEKGILICKDSARRPSGEGYCVFADEEAAAEALKRDNASMGHRWAWSWADAFLILISDGSTFFSPFSYSSCYSVSVHCAPALGQVRGGWEGGRDTAGGTGWKGRGGEIP